MVSKRRTSITTPELQTSSQNFTAQQYPAAGPSHISAVDQPLPVKCGKITPADRCIRVVAVRSIAANFEMTLLISTPFQVQRDCETTDVQERVVIIRIAVETVPVNIPMPSETTLSDVLPRTCSPI